MAVGSTKLCEGVEGIGNTRVNRAARGWWEALSLSLVTAIAVTGAPIRSRAHATLLLHPPSLDSHKHYHTGEYQS